MIYLILILGIFTEAIHASHEIKYRRYPKPQFLLRAFVGVACNTWYFFHNPIQLDLVLSLNLFLFGAYWALFDGILNLMRGLNWFYIGDTKKWDLFWKSEFILIPLAQFLKWLFILQGIFVL